MSEHDRVLFLYNNILLKNPEDNFDLNRETFNMIFSADSNNSDIFGNMMEDSKEIDDFFSFLDDNEESFDAFSYSDEEMDEMLDEMDDEMDDEGNPLHPDDDVQVEVLINDDILLILSNTEEDIQTYIYNYCFLDGYIYTKIPDSELDKAKTLDIVTGYKYKKVFKILGKLENDICYN
jgi:hypothetical protein